MADATARMTTITDTLDFRVEQWTTRALHKEIDVPVLVMVDCGPTQTIENLPSSLQEWIGPSTRRLRRRTTPVEAEMIRAARDDDFDLSLIRDDDLLP